MDKYSNYEELKACEQEGKDFRVITKQKEKANTAVIAPHGGKIEPGTSELALAIAGDDFHLAMFEGIKPSGNFALHITSTNFDEPRCLDVVSRSDLVLALHGARGSQTLVYPGGLDQILGQRIFTALNEAGFSLTEHSDDDLLGASPQNICNRGRQHRGVQLEIARGLRETFFDSLSSEGRKKPTRSFELFVEAVRRGLRQGGAF